MIFADISVFYDEAASRLSGAPIPVIRQQLEATLREFYVQSGAYIAATVPQDIIADQVVYDFDPQAIGNVLLTYAVAVDAVPVEFRGLEVPGQIQLSVVPSDDIVGGLTAAVALKPLSYDTIPEETVTFDFDVILDGLTGRMYMMPDRPWSNVPNAQYYLRKFKQGIGRARVRSKNRFTQAASGWIFPAW